MFGLWSCIVAVGTAYMGVLWSQSLQRDGKAEAANPVKMTHVPLRQISVPIAADGQLKGYVVARLGYISRADDLKKIQLKPEVFLFDAVFSGILQKKLLDMGAIDQNALAAFSRHVKETVNAQLGAEIIQQVVAEELGFVPIDQARGQNPPSSVSAAKPARKGGAR